jgi:hypothetical protein
MSAKDTQRGLLLGKPRSQHHHRRLDGALPNPQYGE